MSVPTVTWAEGDPVGGDKVREGDDRIREAKTQLREVIDVDHDFPSSGQAADVGQHKQVTMQEQADLGSGAVSATILGSQTINGKGELVYTDEDDNDIQLTKAGKSYADLLKDAATLDTSAAPTTDAMVANKKYVDDRETSILAARIIKGIKDYGSSASTGTAKNQNALYIYYGSVSVTTSQAITNLPFASATSYKVTATVVGTAGLDKAVAITQNSGAQFTLYEASAGTKTINWIAIGT